MVLQTDRQSVSTSVVLQGGRVADQTADTYRWRQGRETGTERDRERGRKVRSEAGREGGREGGRESGRVGGWERGKDSTSEREQGNELEGG